MQVEALTRIWNLPPEFEIICRDIWSLHLSLIRDPPPPEPYSYQKEQEDTDKTSSQVNPTQNPSNATLGANAKQPFESPVIDGEDQEDLGEEEKSESEDDSEMEELLRQNSEISSSSDEDDPEDPARTPKRANLNAHGRTKTTRISEGPTSTLAVMMIALWQLRIPVMYTDFARIIESYELPYLDPIRWLPSSMAVHLTKHSIQALSPHHVPGTLSVHRLTARLARRLNSAYGVYTPECNAAPLLWRLTIDLGGTPTLYALAKRMAYILKLPLTLHYSLAPGLKVVRLRDPEHHKFDNVPPEVALMAALVIVLKMTYGLDGKPRHPVSAGDPVLALPRVDKWQAWLKELHGFDAATKGALFSSENVLAVGDLNESLLDDYLGFCEQALLGTENSSSDIIAANQFPVSGSTLRSQIDEIKPSRGAMPAGVLAEDLEAKSLRPAENYAIWNSRDVFGTLAEDFGALLGRAAKRIRIGEDYLGGVVERYERRFVRWWEEEKRREKGEQ
ncbi:hypothetical protein NP233_g12182 [Leucocoprinus birnbaumii]|uniref:Uncharacterized protein n=1 Tax=Leucocoprinus birnbaumii TaxID=56174 RepID=A0AAD5VEV4_9AGAR|nr:hypothetical protein NP233_g12182 [Leucocoprinus birnbaumii]